MVAGRAESHNASHAEKELSATALAVAWEAVARCARRFWSGLALPLRPNQPRSRRRETLCEMAQGGENGAA